MLPFQKQPKIFAAFKAGYDTVSKHLYLVLFPIILDLFLLFGFRITIADLMQSSIQRFVLPPSATADLVASWETFKIQLVEFFRYFSLTSFLRSFPVGIPSLFSFTAFERNPLGEYQFIQLQQPGSVFLVILGLSLIGLFFAYFLYRLIARATSIQSESVESILEPRSLRSWVLIPIVSIIFTLVVIFPAMLLISLIGALLPIFTSIGLLLPYHCYYLPHHASPFHSSSDLSGKNDFHPGSAHQLSHCAIDQRQKYNISFPCNSAELSDRYALADPPG